MTIRRWRTDRNPRTGLAPETAPPGQSGSMPLITLRAAFVLGAGLVTGTAAGILTYLQTGRPAGAFLAGGAACAGAISLLHSIVA
jgi:hypothetical protein